MRRIILALSFIFSFAAKVSAQNFILYNMDFIPQHMYVNPAVIPSNNINIGLPVISSVYTGFSNNGFNLNNLFTTSGGNTILNLAGFIANLKTNNYITTSVNVDLLSFGFKVKKNYFSFNLTEKADIWIRYPKSFFDFLLLGNGAPGIIGNNQNFNFGLSATHYREWGFGFSRELNDKLTVGGKIKILDGMENVTTGKSDVNFNTDPNTFAYTASSNILINSSYDSSRYKNFNAVSYLFNFSNPGLGLDLGASYKPNDKVSFSASLIDLGFIDWNSSVTNYQSQNASFVYNGLSFNALSPGTLNGKNISQQLIDSLKKAFNITNNNHNSYKTVLPAQMYLNGGYRLNSINNANLLLYGQILDGTLRPGVTISLSSKVGRALSSMLSYSAFNSNYNIIGFGLSLNAGPVQLYAVADNILALIIYNNYEQSGGSSFILPAYTNYFNIRFGINLTFGRNAPKKEKVNDDDLDTDKDGIPDKDDACPTEKGPLYTRGCPDADGDSIKDSEDDCPNEYGLRSMKGCPDRDRDGIRDKDDKCPDIPGPIENEGCPLVKLTLNDSLGNTIAIIVKDKNNGFIYEKLLPDDGLKFKLEGEDDTLQTITIVNAGKSRKLIKGDGNYYRFEKPIPEPIKLVPIPVPIPTTTTPMSAAPANVAPLPVPLNPKIQEKPTENNVVAVKLKEEENEIVKTAYSKLGFENGKDVIKEESFVSLSELAALLKKKPAWILQIAGHTDNVGDPKKNLELSEKRAEAVRKFFILSGVEPNRMLISAFGSTKPIADNKTPQGRAKNRRVEMTVVQRDK